jgi:hypothetical protein
VKPKIYFCKKTFLKNIKIKKPPALDFLGACLLLTTCIQLPVVGCGLYLVYREMASSRKKDICLVYRLTGVIIGS